MTVTTYQEWLADGSPWTPCSPVGALALAAHNHGVGIGIIGDMSHLTADPPQDHCPYSHTPWPGAQPYPHVMAIDLMTTDVSVANALIDAKRSGRVPCIKYMNYTDATGNCHHISWEPDEMVEASSDTGHIHISIRTDHVDCSHATGFDPFAVSTPTPVPTGDFALTHWTSVQKGSSGAAVKVAQGILIAHGYSVGSGNGLPDGSFGPITEASTEAMQRAYGIKVDGIFGPHTLSVGLYGVDYAG